jgi:hypothetical protein
VAFSVQKKLQIDIILIEVFGGDDNVPNDHHNNNISGLFAYKLNSP